MTEADRMDSMLAQYYLETDGDLTEVAERMIMLETTTGWDGPGEPPELFTRCTGQVVRVEEDSPGCGTVTVSFPLVNFNLEESGFASLWLSMVGGGTHALTWYRKSRLLDFTLPTRALAYFPGPGFGMQGTRELLDLPANSPVIGTIVKPTSGLTPAQVAELIRQFAAGGIRFIKDDEKMLNAAYCPLRERVEQVMGVLKRLEDETGRRCLYAPHLTTGPHNLERFAETALEAGAPALMVNFFAAGFQSLEVLRRNYQVPIYAHCGGKEALGREPGQGVAPEAIFRFARLLGADYLRTGVIGGYLVGGTREELDSLTAVIREPLPGLKDAAAVLSGGLSPANLAENLQAFGCDVLALAGTGLTRHPQGVDFAVAEMLRVAEAVAAGN